MTIKGVKTIADYKQLRNKKIQAWIDRNFYHGAVTWEMIGANAIRITDGTGDSMELSLSDID